ncbi:hemolysin family protein [Rufibacter quisquiliarum]|uniref:CBS domain containing-hemolysin-like protein n=1 Tax=Rufibacter quisquiliarum TaxID=1549639 RepID=A0A839G948_9BACT|nr:hemolysin family protein [Rufibacter quisquiliarum]MBA9075994.1 CBS domain containing-hemolysin-like protein [Rufibacter quisquiliarum]
MEQFSLYIAVAVGAPLLVLCQMAEVALRHAERVLLQLETQEGATSLTGFLLRRERQTLLTVQLGNTGGLLLLGIGLYGLLYPVLQLLLPAVVSAVLAALSTFLLIWALLSLVGLGVALLTPSALLRWSAAPLAFLLILFSPITLLFQAVFGLFSEKEAENRIDNYANAITLQPFAVRLQTAEEATLAMITAHEVDSKIFHNALEFKNVKVRECMVPRTEIDAIELEEGIEVLREAFIETGHSKILIYQESLDHILGYCHQFSLFNQPKTIEEILTPMEAVPEAMLARELFVMFITEHRSIALVLDEFGGTSGIVTLEDVMEEIIGDINDEYDEEDLLEQPLPEPGSYLFSARQEIDYLNEKYSLNLPEGDYETLGGFILSVLEEIPATGDVVVMPPFEIRILSMDEHRINTVHLSVRQSPAEE